MDSGPLKDQQVLLTAEPSLQLRVPSLLQAFCRGHGTVEFDGLGLA